MNYRNLPAFEASPFQEKIIEDFKFTWTKTKPDFVPVVNQDSGEYQLLAEVPKQFLNCRDAGEFIKIYKGFSEFTKGLSSSADLVLKYILSTLKQDSDEIVVHVQKCMQFCDYKSKSNFYKGITELCTRQLIAKKALEDNTYFINVQFFFNGDRKKLQSFFYARAQYVAQNKPR